MANENETDRRNERLEDDKKKSENASNEAQAAMREGKNLKQDMSLVAAQSQVSEVFGNPTFFRQGADADAGEIHDLVVPNPLQAGGMIDQKTKDELVLSSLKSHDADSLKQINESYRQQYGHDMLDDLKENVSPDAHRRAQEILKGEKDPGYLSPTKADSEKALNSFKDKDGQPLSDYIDAEQLAAIQRNEAMKRGIEDDLGLGTSDPAQFQIETRTDLLKAYPNELKGVDINTVEGAQMYVAAKMAFEVEKFNSNWYGEEAKNPNCPADRREKFERIQKEWNDAVAKGDKEATRKLLAERYNPGNPKQESEVEAQRAQTPNGNRFRDVSNSAGETWSRIKSWVGAA
ncbi:MAG: hypothetical protein IT342_22895 [Candidatus Melainabacteria bacterium]|nr:hypothetical protein [Candidatus Melainabacteria bacterium]